MYAAQCDHDQVCRLLLYYGASPYLKSNEGQTAAQIAWDWGHQSVLNVLAPGWKLPATIAAEEALAAANAAAAEAAASATAAGQTTLATAAAVIPPVTNARARRSNKNRPELVSQVNLKKSSIYLYLMNVLQFQVVVKSQRNFY
jgi:hypothetical protein